MFPHVALLTSQGGAAVAGLSQLAPWFGAAVSVQGDAFCAGGLELLYAPLVVRLATVGW